MKLKHMGSKMFNHSQQTNQVEKCSIKVQMVKTVHTTLLAMKEILTTPDPEKSHHHNSTKEPNIKAQSKEGNTIK